MMSASSRTFLNEGLLVTVPLFQPCDFFSTSLWTIHKGIVTGRCPTKASADGSVPRDGGGDGSSLPRFILKDGQWPHVTAPRSLFVRFLVELLPAVILVVAICCCTILILR